MTLPLYDLIARLAIDGDNPYPRDDGTLKDKLIGYRDAHPEEFQFIKDWKNSIHTFYEIESTSSNNVTIDGVKLTENTKLQNIPKISNVIKNFFTLGHTKLKFSNELIDWAKNQDNEVEENEDENNEEEVVEENDENEEEIEEEAKEEIAFPISTSKSNDNNVEISSYNFTSNYTITYDELAKLCMNQAKKNLISQKARNLEIERVEVKKRDEICRNITKYFNLPDIENHFKQGMLTKLDKMPIAELELLQKQCEDQFDRLKTKQMIGNILVTAGIGYNSLFPNGIPFGKSKYLSIDQGITKQISSMLFDVRSVPGHAFDRILEKHHIHLSDEAAVSIELLKILITQIHVVKKDENEDGDENEEEEEIEEDYEENEEEEEIEEVDE